MFKKLVFVLLIAALFAMPGQASAQSSAFEDYYPVLSPDGTRLAFLSDRDGAADIYIVGSDGSGDVYSLNVNEDEKTSIGRPSWSPESNAVSFVVYNDRYYWDEGDLCIYNLDLGETVCPEKLQDITLRQEWGPYNIAVIMGGLNSCNNMHLVFLNPDTFEITEYVGSWFEALSWSTGGRLLASNSCDGVGDWVVFNSHGDLTQKLADASNFSSPAWAPKTSLLAYITRDGNDIRILNVANGQVVTIEIPDSLYAWNLSWSPNGQKIAFFSHIGGSYILSPFYVEVQTGKIFQVPSPEGVKFYSDPPVWVDNETLVAMTQYNPLSWLSLEGAELLSD